jgi:ABC-type transport system involved in multi-copper enzyme maturation permease subunit
MRILGFTRTTTVIRAVGWVTFREIVRDKVLYNIIMCSALLFSVSFLASRLTFIRPDRVLVDFGLSALRLSCAMIATFNGAAMVGRELERRTIIVALSRPVSRYQFVAGKFAGLAAVLAVNCAVLAAAFALMVWGASGNAGLVFNSTFFWAAVMAYLESLVVGGMAVFFSSFSTTSLAAILTIGFYLIGHNISQVLAVAARVRVAPVASLLRWVALFLPNLEHFELGTQLTYLLPLEGRFILLAVAYALATVAVFVLLAGALLKDRES